MRAHKYPALVPRIQKNRFKLSCYKTILKYGSVGIYCLNNIQLYHKTFKKIKKLLKRRKRVSLFKTRIWHFLTINYPVSKKSTNSRMGKGKGAMIGWNIKIRAGKILFEFKGYSPKRISYIVYCLNKYRNHKFLMVTKQNYKINSNKHINTH